MQEIMAKLEQLENLNDLERLRVEVMGKKGILTQQFALLKNLEGETKKPLPKSLTKIKKILKKCLKVNEKAY